VKSSSLFAVRDDDDDGDDDELSDMLHYEYDWFYMFLKLQFFIFFVNGLI